MQETQRMINASLRNQWDKTSRVTTRKFEKIIPLARKDGQQSFPTCNFRNRLSGEDFGKVNILRSGNRCHECQIGAANIDLNASVTSTPSICLTVSFQ